MMSSSESYPAPPPVSNLTVTGVERLFINSKNIGAPICSHSRFPNKNRLKASHNNNIVAAPARGVRSQGDHIIDFGDYPGFRNNLQLSHFSIVTVKAIFKSSISNSSMLCTVEYYFLLYENR
jgi:hypothetical protein